MEGSCQERIFSTEGASKIDVDALSTTSATSMIDRDGKEFGQAGGIMRMPFRLLLLSFVRTKHEVLDSLAQHIIMHYTSQKAR